MDVSPPKYTHETAEWPYFRWDHATFSERLAAIHFRRGRLITTMATLGFEARQETMLSTLVQDVLKSSEIEGENLDAAQVRSSIARRLGIDVAGLPEADRYVDGVVEMTLDATQRFDAPLDAERIFGWHAALFPTGRSGMFKIVVGAWRDDANGPMQVVSGPMGKEKVHFEAPAAGRLEAEMDRFLHWFETASIDPVLRAAIAHLWFVTIHPLDDGNGRVGRAIMDMALARADGRPQRFYSMSAQIRKERNGYYDILEKTQKGAMDVTPWVQWFLGCLDKALISAEGVLDTVRAKQAFWDEHRDDGLNERQTKILNLLFEGFHGKLQTGKYAKIAKCSVPTAFRDLADLLARGILLHEEGGGRNTSYRFPALEANL
ncbi:Fic family protein [soil metagenome]